jgi:large subunit ribosomal protein L33
VAARNRGSAHCLRSGDGPPAPFAGFAAFGAAAADRVRRASASGTTARRRAPRAGSAGAASTRRASTTSTAGAGFFKRFLFGSFAATGAAGFVRDDRDRSMVNRASYNGAQAAIRTRSAPFQRVAVCEMGWGRSGFGIPTGLPIFAALIEGIMAKKGNRVQVILECTEHKNSGVPGTSRYVTTKNRKNTPERMEIKKFNPVLRKYTIHKEIK